MRFDNRWLLVKSYNYTSNRTWKLTQVQRITFFISEYISWSCDCVKSKILSPFFCFVLVKKFCFCIIKYTKKSNSKWMENTRCRHRTPPPLPTKHTYVLTLCSWYIWLSDSQYTGPGHSGFFMKLQFLFYSKIINWWYPNECCLVKNTVKPVCNDQLYNKMHCLWFIQ